MRVLVYGVGSDILGGIETFLFNMNSYMSKDCIFDYVIEGQSTIHKNRIKSQGGKVYYIAPKRQMKKNIEDWKRLLSEKKNEFDVVYFNVYALSWIFPIKLCKKAGLPVVVHAHNNNLHDCSMAIKAMHVVGKQILKHMDVKRLTNSKLSSEFMFGDPDVGEMIYNAIDINRFKYNEVERNRIRSELKITDKHVYGFTGRIMYQKNPLFLIDIFDEIQKRDSSAVLVIVGDGDLMSDVIKNIRAKKIEEKVILLGHKDNVEEYYQAMDVYILPSRFEGLGIVLIEAQTAGLPCFTSADVVPQEAKATNLLKYISLNCSSAEWSKKVMENCNLVQDRSEYVNIIEKSRYNIVTESKKTEKYLRNICK